jgi:prepilin-type processing-associated H-X9-DG protein
MGFLANDALTLPTATLYAGLDLCSTQYKQLLAIPPAAQVFYPGVGPEGNRWAWGGTGCTLFHTIVPPNSTRWTWGSCIGCGCAVSEAPYANAQSNHPGGVNVGMADGSAKFVKDTINMTTWMQIGTRAGNEPVDGASY